MKKNKIFLVSKIIIFLIIGIILYLHINDAFMEKSTYGKYLNFKKMENVDVLVLGSSHSDNGIGAEDMEGKLAESLGCEVDVYNYSIYGMRIEQMYYVFKELLKKQKPEVIVIETFSFVQTEPENREILARRAFDYFPLSLNKLEAVRYCTDGNYKTYLVPIMKYHTRWKELTINDIGYRYRDDLWGEYGRKYSTIKDKMETVDDYFKQDFAGITEQQKLGDRTEEKLQDILALAKENNIKVLFLSIPFKEQLGVNSVENIRMNNYVYEHYVDGDSVQMLDLNKQMNEMKFDYKYLYNEGHCNKTGAKKVTKKLSAYIAEHYSEILGGKSR